MENQQLQATIDREIQVRQQMEKQWKEVKSEVTEKNEFGFNSRFFFSFKYFLFIEKSID
jgi:hypothetical protein